MNLDQINSIKAGQTGPSEGAFTCRRRCREEPSNKHLSVLAGCLRSIKQQGWKPARVSDHLKSLRTRQRKSMARSSSPLGFGSVRRAAERH